MRTCGLALNGCLLLHRVKLQHLLPGDGCQWKRQDTLTTVSVTYGLPWLRRIYMLIMCCSPANQREEQQGMASAHMDTGGVPSRCVSPQRPQASEEDIARSKTMDELGVVLITTASQ